MSYRYQNLQTQAVMRYIIDTYGAEPEFLWEKYPHVCIFRNERTRKWFTLVNRIKARQLGVDADGEVEILNLHFDRHQARDFVQTHPNLFPAYHMNKDNWFSVLLDGGLSDEAIFELIEKSYLLSN